MWQSKRTVSKKRKSGRIKKVIFLLVVVIFLASIGYAYWYYQKLHTRAYISPLPHTLAKIFSPINPTKQVEDALSEKHVAFSRVNIATESSYLITLPGGEEILISKEKNIPMQIASLQLILSRLTIEGKGFSRLDLRFDKPVVVFKDK